MFIDGVIDDVRIIPVQRFCDDRGWLAELFRQDEIDPALVLVPVMAYISYTLPGIARGPHEHREQEDFFMFIGPGSFAVYLWDGRDGSPTQHIRQVVHAGEKTACSIRVPPGIVHAYKNIGDTPGLVLNLPDRLYAGFRRQEKVDEIRYENAQHNPYVVD